MGRKGGEEGGGLTGTEIREGGKGEGGIERECYMYYIVPDNFWQRFANSS